MATLKDNKWFVENVANKQDIKLECNPKQGVYISKVTDSVITIVGKANTIVAENVNKSGIIFDDIISTVEVINSKKLQVQANGSIPSIAIDKSQGVTVFLQTAEGQKASILTSLSSEVNIILPGKTDNDDSVEFPVPSQFVSKIVGGKVVTTPSEHV
eukprot:TRINITY_DN752_c0_g1_i1.p2 TRINITY_DN752_c0_g1~~TRINITY_DN752_c0_g1_i1.p2  ORF type:complete len:157 (-),score=40.31 TRINITY_DN752_c0_g1_i1:33-503(-)